MEENENVEKAENVENAQNVEKVQNVEVNETVVEETASESNEGIKSKKGLIIAIIVALIACCLVFNLLFNEKGKAKNVIKDFCTALGKGKYQKALKLIDPVGMYVFEDLEEEDYKEFWDEYKDFKKSEDWEDDKEDWEELLDDAKETEEDFDKDDAIKTKVKKITSFKKVGKKLYEVKARIKNEDEKTEKVIFYMMKDGFSYKLVGGDVVSAIVRAIEFGNLDF